MNLHNLAIPTAVIHPGSRIQDFFETCLIYGAPGLPYVDATGTIVGRLSIRHVFKCTCIPDYVLRAAHLLGDNIESVNVPRVQVSHLLQEPVEKYVLKEYAVASSHTPVVKGLAIMEQLNTNYLFVIDENDYKGIVTHMAIAHRVIEQTDNLEL